jgi:hypothetical protein
VGLGFFYLDPKIKKKEKLFPLIINLLINIWKAVVCVVQNSKQKNVCVCVMMFSIFS